MNFVCAHNDFAVVGSESGVGRERHSEEGAYGSASGVSGCYFMRYTVVVSLSGEVEPVCMASSVACRVLR